jgi:hypothetical protein
MDQDVIDAAVAAATGESISEIRHHGFTLADPLFQKFDPEPTRLLKTDDFTELTSILTSRNIHDNLL